MKSLDANENKWIGNLRDDHLVHKKQLGVLILNDNTKIQNSIVEENVLILRVVREAINGPYVIIIRGWLLLCREMAAIEALPCDRNSRVVENPTKKRFQSHGSASFTAISRLSINPPRIMVLN